MTLSKTVIDALLKGKNAGSKFIKEFAEEATKNGALDGFASEISTAKKMKGAASGLFKETKSLHKPNVLLPGTNHVLKSKYGVGAGLAVGAAGLAWSMHGDVETSKLGKMEGGTLANTVSGSFSPGVEKMLDSAESPDVINGIFKDNKNLQLKNGSAGGDLVFALHELRNGD